MRGKYGNRRTEVDGVVFASKAEARRYGELRLLERAGEIRNLVCQPRFELQPPYTLPDGTKVRAVVYVGDFLYWERDAAGEWREIVSDTKGARTQAFEIKAKLFRYRYPHIELRIEQAD